MQLYGRQLLESFARTARGGWRYRLVIAAALFSVLLGAACDDDDDPVIVTTVVTPVANAGSDQTVSKFATVTLDGSGSTGAVTYAWSLSSGASVTLSDPNVANPNFIAPAQTGDLVFSLVVNNGTQTDTVTITVGEIDDPFFSNQWHLNNTAQNGAMAGEDAKALEAWTNQFVFGSGVRIAVVDDGLEIAHEDLQANVVSGSSYHYADQGTDPTGTASARHGTSVGGVAVGVGFNGKGVSGAAPRAQLVGYSLLTNFTTANEGDAMSRDAVSVWISNNSWGPQDSTGQFQANSGTVWETAVMSGITSGRGGNGILYIWAAGNGGTDNFDNSNYDNYANFPYVIAVCAVGDKGKRASYSEKGANLLLCAPSQGDSGQAITTVDRTGALGYNQTGSTPNLSDLNYTNTFNGTSSAAPLAAGVIALILEANPNLTWRDVRLLLAETARQNDATDPDWTTNAGTTTQGMTGYNINHKYGFGVVDADAAVARAKTYTGFLTGAWASHTASFSPGTAIPNGSSSVANTIAVTGSGITRIESIQVEFTTDHTSPGDLTLTLTNSLGTTSVLAEAHDCRTLPANVFVNCSTALISGGFKFSTVRHMGEAADGNWELKVEDLDALGSSFNGSGNFQSWSITFYGR